MRIPNEHSDCQNTVQMQGKRSRNEEMFNVRLTHPHPAPLEGTFLGGRIRWDNGPREESAAAAAAIQTELRTTTAHKRHAQLPINPVLTSHCY